MTDRDPKASLARAALGLGLRTPNRPYLFERRHDGTLLDRHDHPVASAVRDLYAHAWQIGGPFPTLLECDERIPSMPEALAELAKARGARGSPRAAPAWLAELQARFGAVLLRARQTRARC